MSRKKNLSDKDILNLLLLDNEIIDDDDLISCVNSGDEIVNSGDEGVNSGDKGVNNGDGDVNSDNLGNVLYLLQVFIYEGKYMCCKCLCTEGTTAICPIWFFFVKIISRSNCEYNNIYTHMIIYFFV